MNLPRDIEELKRAVSRGQRFKYIFFWGHRRKRAGAIDKSCFSQWFPADFEVEGQRYGSAEHFMMAEKARLFSDWETLDKILNAKNPGAARRFEREVEGFIEQKWQAACFEVVVRGNPAKFSQNPGLGDFLRQTKTRILAEASPVDRMWGIGLAHDHDHAGNPLMWPGRNLLGFALIEVRRMIAS